MIWEIIPHTADHAFRAYGHNHKELIMNSFKALKESMFSKANTYEIPIEEISIEIESADQALMIIDLLREIHYRIVVDRILPTGLKIKHLNERSLQVMLKFHPIGPEDITKIDIKAITYHDIKIIKRKKYYTIDIVCDV